ncbi:MAG: hypothetical protein J7K00_03670 [Candidatus Diapherotrites archaeon]|nr:hypothetical protein [Candidatus Diapherotrites archaeon]
MEFGVKKVAFALFSFLVLMAVCLLLGLFVEQFSFMKMDNPTFALITVPAFFLGFLLPEALLKYFGEEPFGFALSVPVIFVFLTVAGFVVSVSIFLPALYGSSNLDFAVNVFSPKEMSFDTQYLEDGTAKTILIYNPCLMLVNSAVIFVAIFGFFGILTANIFDWYRKEHCKEQKSKGN